MKKSENKSKTSSKPVSSRPQETPVLSKGLLIILSAPSGCGKTTIADRLLKRHPEWIRSISATTRPPRVGEKEGEDYYFVDILKFRRMQSEGDLLESAQVFNSFYGTPKFFVMEKLLAGKNIILAIDVQGTKQIKKTLDKKAKMITFFILPPSVRVLRERLEGRNTESPAEIQRRIELAQEEIKEAAFYDHTVMNQNLEQTVFQIEDYIEKFLKERS